jgi:hypothetical protein
VKENDIYTCMEWVGVKGERPSIIHDHGRLIFKQLKRKKIKEEMDTLATMIKCQVTGYIFNV